MIARLRRWWWQTSLRRQNKAHQRKTQMLLDFSVKRAMEDERRRGLR